MGLDVPLDIGAVSGASANVPLSTLKHCVVAV